MNRKVRDLYWFAGLLEGEGSFFIQRYAPALYLKMTDLDVVQKAHYFTGMKGDIHIIKHKSPKHQDSYWFRINGQLAVEWMMTLYPLLGIRRKAKIRSILRKWKILEKGRRNTLEHTKLVLVALDKLEKEGKLA